VKLKHGNEAPNIVDPITAIKSITSIQSIKSRFHFAIKSNIDPNHSKLQDFNLKAPCYHLSFVTKFSNIHKDDIKLNLTVSKQGKHKIGSKLNQIKIFLANM